MNPTVSMNPAVSMNPSLKPGFVISIDSLNIILIARNNLLLL
jgi:hypothetical protein